VSVLTNNIVVFRFFLQKLIEVNLRNTRHKSAHSAGRNKVRSLHQRLQNWHANSLRRHRLTPSNTVSTLAVGLPVGHLTSQQRPTHGHNAATTQTWRAELPVLGKGSTLPVTTAVTSVKHFDHLGRCRKPPQQLEVVRPQRAPRRRQQWCRIVLSFPFSLRLRTSVAMADGDLTDGPGRSCQ
jgi:hypothetical protein